MIRRFRRFLPRAPYFLLALIACSAVRAQDRIPTNVTILHREDFVGRNYFSVADAIEGEPSIDLQRDGARGTRAVAKIRGTSSAKRVLVLLDGVPLTHEFDEEVDLSQIPVNIAERIEITRGGSPLAWGAESIGGAINIVTSRPEQKGLDVRLGTGNGRNGVRHHHGRFIGRSNLGDLTYLTSQEHSGGFSYNESSDMNSHFGNVSRSFKGKGFWGVEYYYQDSDVGVSNGTPVPFEKWNGTVEREPVDHSARRRQDSQHIKATLASPKTKNGTLLATFTQSYRDAEDRATNDGPVTEHQESRASTADLQWKMEGTDIGIQQRDMRREVRPLPANAADQYGFYARHEFAGARWTAVPQVRYDQHTKAGGFFAPRMAFIYSAGENVDLSANAAGAFRAPSFDELYSSSGPTGNSNLNPEKGQTYDAGVDFHPNETYGVKLTGFLTRTDDLIHVSPISNQWINGGTEKTGGVETEASVRTGPEKKFPHAAFRATYTFQRSRKNIQDGSGEIDSAFTPHQLGFFRIDQYLPMKFTLTNELRYESERFSQDGKRGLRLAPFYVWNIHLALVILKADLYFDVQNVTQRHYAENAGAFLAPQPNRTYWCGVSIRFEN